MDIPWLAGATISGGIIAPVSLMLGLNLMTGFSTSLLLNLEGVMTALIAVFFFRENSGRNLWVAIALMTAAGVLLGWDPDKGSFNFAGLGLIVLAMVSWGADNNLTRMICTKDPVQIAQVKSLVAGASVLAASLVIGERLDLGTDLLLALVVGSLCYGASLVLFIKSLELLGSLRTGAFFSLGPFVGAAASLELLGERLGWLMLPAGLLMAAGVCIIATERHVHKHRHHAVTHDHLHDHADGHHLHEHFGSFHSPHSHAHTHGEMEHDHQHRPDTHHRHGH
jgi:drug/metabolite transporter (DMT)-like permease